MNIQSNFIHNQKNLKTPNANQYVNEQTIEYPYKEIPLSDKKDGLANS